MDWMAPIAGVSLEKYAELCASMAHTGTDTALQQRLAAEQGVDAASWEAAKQGWTARMQDPAAQGKVAHAFVPLYGAAQARARGGAEPGPIELYARVVAGYSFEKGPDGNKLPVEAVLAREGLSTPQWQELTTYWTPKVNDPADPSARTFRELVQKESDRIFGIVRDAPAPAPQAAPTPAPAAVSPRPAPSDPLSQLIEAVMKLLKSIFG